MLTFSMLYAKWSALFAKMTVIMKRKKKSKNTSFDEITKSFYTCFTLFMMNFGTYLQGHLYQRIFDNYYYHDYSDYPFYYTLDRPSAQLYPSGVWFWCSWWRPNILRMDLILHHGHSLFAILVNNMGILQFGGKYVARHDQRIFAVTFNTTTS